MLFTFSFHSDHLHPTHCPITSLPLQNQSLLSILIAFSKIVLVLIDTYFPRFSRRNLHQCSQLVVILCFVLLSWLVLVDHHGIGILLINVVGTVFIEFTWDACYLCSVDLCLLRSELPQSVRARCWHVLALCSLR
ncbi:hypothetical protein niasHS_016711 [Heterodera schachtii]|uniref:Uncharacterized protein n=1 Tax=Heterodera schachtii TaxID=97005 RepID=A0ABD2HXP1_HETSC